MFIIVGHDVKNQQVMVHDTADHTTMPANYKIVEKVLRKGYKIKGLDEQGNIICNNSDVFDELRLYLKPLLAKALLLQLDKLKIAELIFPVCKKYGVVDKPFDLEVNTQACTITFYLIGVSYHYKEDKIEKFHSVKHLKEFEQLPEEAQYMLQELYKMPLKLKHSDLIITEINQLFNHSYLIRFKDGIIMQVTIHYYDKDFSKLLDTLDETACTAVFKHYIRRLAEEKPKGPYFISQLRRWRNSTFNMKTRNIYTR